MREFWVSEWLVTRIKISEILIILSESNLADEPVAVDTKKRS